MKRLLLMDNIIKYSKEKNAHTRGKKRRLAGRPESSRSSSYIINAKFAMTDALLKAFGKNMKSLTATYSVQTKQNGRLGLQFNF